MDQDLHAESGAEVVRMLVARMTTRLCASS